MSVTLFLAIAVGGYLPFRGPASLYAVYVLSFAMAFLAPAQLLESPSDLLRRWKPSILWILAGTAVWDAGTALVGSRPLLALGGAVYGSAILVFGLFLLVHATIVGWMASAGARGERP